MSSPNREKIKALIETGEHTRASIQEELGLSAASLATNFSYLRMMGFYPVVTDKETNILGFVDADTWEAQKAERVSASTSSASAKSPRERYDALQNRLTRHSKTAQLAGDRASNDPDNEILDLKFQKAEIDLKITTLEIDTLTSSESYIEFMKNYDDSADEEEEVPEPNEEEVEDELA